MLPIVAIFEAQQAKRDHAELFSTRHPVYKHLLKAGPQTHNQIAISLEITGKGALVALRALQVYGLVEDRGDVWRAATQAELQSPGYW